MRGGTARWSWLAALLLACVLVTLTCRGGGEKDAGRPAGAGADWALAIHGGAGVPRDSLDEEQQRAYRASLERALRIGLELLEQGGTSLDTVEAVVRDLEDDPLFNAGRGAVFTADGTVELDASIMDGATLACGAVTGVRTVKNPVSLARLVMTRTPHVLLSQTGAERFAAEVGVELMEEGYFFTERRWQALQRHNEARAARPGGTVGAVALDRHGDLAAATSTGGLTGKRAGRVGDTPLVGSGTYADNTTCAVSATGRGEEFIRHNVAHAVSALIEHRGLELQQAAEHVVLEKLQPGDGGIIAVDRDGRIAMVFNTPGMFRGAADAGGRFEVAIWR